MGNRSPPLNMLPQGDHPEQVSFGFSCASLSAQIGRGELHQISDAPEFREHAVRLVLKQLGGCLCGHAGVFVDGSLRGGLCGDGDLVDLVRGVTRPLVDSRHGICAGGL